MPVCVVEEVVGGTVALICCLLVLVLFAVQLPVQVEVPVPV